MLLRLQKHAASGQSERFVSAVARRPPPTLPLLNRSQWHRGREARRILVPCRVQTKNNSGVSGRPGRPVRETAFQAPALNEANLVKKHQPELVYLLTNFSQQPKQEVDAVTSVVAHKHAATQIMTGRWRPRFYK